MTADDLHDLGVSFFFLLFSFSFSFLIHRSLSARSSISLCPHYFFHFSLCLSACSSATSAAAGKAKAMTRDGF